MRTFLSCIFIVLTAFAVISCDSSNGGGTTSEEPFHSDSGIQAVSRTEGDNQTVKVGGLAGSVPPGSEVTVTNLNTGEIQTTTASEDGSFDPEFTASTDDVFEVFADGVFIARGGITVLQNIVETGIANTGTFPSTIKNYLGLTYIVNSGSNNVQIFDFNSGSSDLVGTIVLPPGSNPIEIEFAGNEAYVSNFVSQSIALVNLDTFSCETLITSTELDDITPCQNQVVIEGAFEEPFDIAVEDESIFVSNNNFNDNFDPAGPGFVTVLDRNTLSLVDIITASGANSATMELINGDLYLVNAGDANFEVFPPTCNTDFTPSVDIINTQTLSVSETINIPLDEENVTVCQPQFASVTPDGSTAYLGLGLAGAFLKIDTLSNTLLRGTDNPIIITDLSGLNLANDMQILPNGIGLISLFNSDEIVAFDIATDTINPFPFPFSIPAGIAATNPDSQIFDGVQNLLLVSPDFNSTDVIAITGISELITRIKLDQIFSP